MKMMSLIPKECRADGGADEGLQHGAKEAGRHNLQRGGERGILRREMRVDQGQPQRRTAKPAAEQ